MIFARGFLVCFTQLQGFCLVEDGGRSLPSTLLTSLHRMTYSLLTLTLAYTSTPTLSPRMPLTACLEVATCNKVGPGLQRCNGVPPLFTW